MIVGAAGDKAGDNAVDSADNNEDGDSDDDDYNIFIHSSMTTKVYLFLFSFFVRCCNG